ncbi:MAG: hypothetical protein ACT4QA_20830 [Panacagrimonas sp.]
MTLCLIALLGGCSSTGDDGAEATPGLAGEELGAKNFLLFLNRQPSLAAGDYTLVAATAVVGQSGNYQLSLRFDDGRTQLIQGNWTSSGGPDAVGGNPRHLITLDRPGGLDATLSSSVDAVLLLLDRSANRLAQDADGPDGSDARIVLAQSTTDDAAYARAYYATIDPLNLRTTLADWKRVNGFDTPDEDAAVVFRDTRDLGYGRNMHMKRKGLDGSGQGSVAFYVDNYQLVEVAGLDYSAINLDAAIEQTQRFYIGTNALEFGPLDADGNGVADDPSGDAQKSFVRFYAFSPRPPYERVLALDMDGLGEKGMPIPCITCHGGRADPILPNGRFPREGDVRGRLQPLDVDEMDISTTRAGFTRAALEADFKAINRAVYHSYAPGLVSQSGEWNSSEARKLIEAWYGGPDLPNGQFLDQYVPQGWGPDATPVPPVDSVDLYRNVVSDNCRICHLLRGTRDNCDVDFGSFQDNCDIDFSSFAKFNSYVDDIEPLVYDSGRMPLGLVAYNTLFTGAGLLEKLADFLPDFSRRNAQGAILRPGRAIADAGPDRRSVGPVAVSGIASRAALSHSWRIVSQPPGANATLMSADRVRVVLHAEVDGAYELELSVIGAAGERSTDRTRITLDSGLALPSSDPPAPSDISFETHILPLLENSCFSCHGQSTSVRPPLLMTPPVPPESRDVYTDVRARVNFDDPEQSPLLTRPSGLHHGGSRITGFDLSGDQRNYDLLLEWILEGARQR